MPYRDRPPKKLLDELEETGRQLEDARKTLLAVRLVLVVAGFLIAIQIISNCILVRMNEKPVPAEKPP